MGIDDFSQLKESMDAFQTKLHQYLVSNKQQLATRAEAYWGTESEKLKKIETLKSRLTELEERKTALDKELKSSQHELNEANAQSKAFHTKREKLLEEREFLHRELDKLDVLLTEHTHDLEREHQSRLMQSSKDEKEVKLFEDFLGLHISSTSQDVITFSFSTGNVCYITLDVSQDSYTITESNPELPQIIKNELVKDLNTTDDLRTFLKNSRSHLLTLSSS